MEIKSVRSCKKYLYKYTFFNIKNNRWKVLFLLWKSIVKSIGGGVGRFRKFIDIEDTEEIGVFFFFKTDISRDKTSSAICLWNMIKKKCLTKNIYVNFTVNSRFYICNNYRAIGHRKNVVSTQHEKKKEILLGTNKKSEK